jgi:hypothetical protein
MRLRDIGKISDSMSQSELGVDDGKVSLVQASKASSPMTCPEVRCTR